MAASDATQVVHAGKGFDLETGALMPPLTLASTYAWDGLDAPKDYVYTRVRNPNRAAFEAAVCALEQGEAAFAFASGCAAMDALMRWLRPGQHLLACREIYGGTHRLLTQHLRGAGVETRWFSIQDTGTLERGLEEAPALLWLESPTNPLLRLIDLEAACAAAKRAGVRVVVDNTFATPMLQKPLTLGADAVVHSTTKYLNGHSDVCGGVVVSRDAELSAHLYEVQRRVGAVPSPFDCYLALRGLKTLALRIKAHSEGALALAQALEGHPRIRRVIYPGLESHPEHALAQRQMQAFGGVLSLELEGDRASLAARLKRLEHITLAESLGAVESIVTHPASMSHAAMTPEARAAAGISDGLLRLSVGIEAPGDLLADLQQALAD